MDSRLEYLSNKSLAELKALAAEFKLQPAEGSDRRRKETWYALLSEYRSPGLKARTNTFIERARKSAFAGAVAVFEAEFGCTASPALREIAASLQETETSPGAIDSEHLPGDSDRTPVETDSDFDWPIVAEPREHSPAAEVKADFFTDDRPPNRGDERGGRISLDASPSAIATRPESRLTFGSDSSDAIAISPGEFPDMQSALAEIARLRAENKRLHEENSRAKDISPVRKPSFLRVSRLAQSACLDLCKTPNGWLLSMGKNLKRKFSKLQEIWELLIQKDWHLMELFEVREPEPESTPQPIFPRKPYSKFITIPFCDDGLIDSDALNIYAAGGGRSPPVATC